MSPDIESVFIILMQFHVNLKLFHFQTKSYAAHKASDELYNTMADLIDTFLEVWQGKLGRRLSPVHGNIKVESINSTTSMIQETKLFIIYLKSAMRKKCKLTRNTDLCNILDELTAALAKFVYLLSFN